MEKIKVKLTTTADRIERFLANLAKVGKDKRTESFLNARLQLLENYWTQYLKVYDELCDAVTSEQLKEDAYFTSDSFSKVECCYIEAVCFVTEQLKLFRRASVNPEESPLSSTVISNNANQALRLPKINIPNFSGSYLEWPSFRDTYTSLIHDNNTLSQIQKMHYLKSAISGDAAKLLQHLALTEANYFTAWKSLADRYDNPRVLATSNLSVLINLPAMSSESAAELRRVLDNFSQSVRALENLGRPVKAWNDWLVFFLSNKLDNSTRKDWETSLSTSNQIPTFEELKTFLEGRIHTLNAISDSPHSGAKLPTQGRNAKPITRNAHSTTSNLCAECQGRHFVMFCPRFRAKAVDARIAFVNSKRLCLNCLRAGHSVANCTQVKRCQLCNQAHHTMLHKVAGSTQQPPVQGQDRSVVSRPVERNSSQSQPTTSVTSHLAGGHQTDTSVLLATAIVFARSADGRLIKARALLDQGSESSFITASLANLLRLPRQKVNISVSGIGACETKVVKASVVHDVVSVTDSTYSYTVQSLILPTLTHLMPSRPIPRRNWPHLTGLSLADPEYNKPSRVDLILGADIYARILRPEIRTGTLGAPVAQCTALGWILSGSVDTSTDRPASVVSYHNSISDLDALLRKFWEVEEPPKTSTLAPDEEECEKHFAESHYRNEKGRYIVRLPLKRSSSVLGQSQHIALSALLRLERRFLKDNALLKSYSAFMDEYLLLNHMTPVRCDTNSSSIYYLPHHAVVKPTSSTTRLRVVFNASQKTTSGLSLNDILHVGPKLQNDIMLIILRWRFYPLCFSADIEKMFRQILVDEKDIDLQRILWRESPSDPISEFQLRTVTYGTTSAPYLACKTLRQLAQDYSDVHPEAACLLKDNFYVDDALFGSFDKQSALVVRDEIQNLLKLGGFNLRKWASNCPDLLEGIPVEDRELKASVQVLSDQEIKALGLGWSPGADKFSFHVDLPPSSAITKRTVLSDISRLYDPLGWLAPVIINAKIFLQRLWLAKVDWDENLSEDLARHWLDLRQDLRLLDDVHVDRWLGTSSPSHTGWELHGYCDASLSAYGAVIYLRISHGDNVKISLLAAKTRVSPIKTVSLPRLELCGAALLANLASYLQNELKLTSVPLYLWTDSTIVLAWLREHPTKWTVYVANRVSNIHQLVPHATWLHIRSNDNPADCISRGISAAHLKTHELWWTGPPNLKNQTSTWNPSVIPATIQELRPSATLITQQTNSGGSLELLHRFSSLSKLLRITALCIRFVKNSSKPVKERTLGWLSTEDLNNALLIWIRVIQQHSFPEISTLAKGQALSSASSILKLHPFLDQQNILRVGERLKDSFLSYDERHPIILPKHSHLSYLLIQHAHISTLHGGVQHTLHNVRSKYWILHCRSKVRQVVGKCVICCRHRAQPTTQFMGDLPQDRVRPSKPFSKAGVDYAGPFNVTPVKRRGCKATKSYVAVFVCFVTRAIHLELVMDLTAEAFVAAFKRFVGRRGRCERLYSDNATYFTAANKQISLDLKRVLQQSSVRLLDLGTDWHFMPPAAPNFGGIWESGVKSFKHHFRRVVGDHVLSIEEMLTLIIQIEACLNSRPLHALSDDPSELSAITPGHFLVGEALSTVPAPSVLHTPIHRLNRWEVVQRIKEDLWKSWYKDYLHHLQIRHKWTHNRRSLEPNDLVVIRDERLPPAKWLLGRVVTVHPGKDGHVRVVTVRHKEGEFKRPVTKLCWLPVQAQSDA